MVSTNCLFLIFVPVSCTVWACIVLFGVPFPREQFKRGALQCPVVAASPSHYLYVATPDCQS
eukprot:1995122-Amphidinium_carterae.1